MRSPNSDFDLMARHHDRIHLSYAETLHGYILCHLAGFEFFGTSSISPQCWWKNIGPGQGALVSPKLGTTEGGRGKEAGVG